MVVLKAQLDVVSVLVALLGVVWLTVPGSKGKLPVSAQEKGVICLT